MYTDKGDGLNYGIFKLKYYAVIKKNMATLYVFILNDLKGTFLKGRKAR